ncbi:hypothetical protein [Kitasatospora sp. NPDC087314]|uniref:hypothetical protein n=1 Tax=Kitasatospora sp. NPDC087314 TaxID=3364068 RepID=UPI003814E5E6
MISQNDSVPTLLAEAWASWAERGATLDAASWDLALLDLIAAVGGPPPADGALLVEVADPVAFIEAAAGRGTEAVLPVIR